MKYFYAFFIVITLNNLFGSSVATDALFASVNSSAQSIRVRRFFYMRSWMASQRLDSEIDNISSASQSIAEKLHDDCIQGKTTKKDADAELREYFAKTEGYIAKRRKDLEIRNKQLCIFRAGDYTSIRNELLIEALNGLLMLWSRIIDFDSEKEQNQDELGQKVWVHMSTEVLPPEIIFLESDSAVYPTTIINSY